MPKKLQDLTADELTKLISSPPLPTPSKRYIDFTSNELIAELKKRGLFDEVFKGQTNEELMEPIEQLLQKVIEQDKFVKENKSRLVLLDKEPKTDSNK